ncbi:hypothetical protein [Pseudomonas citronellolis]|uniref:hypothetical protein n=1 Tax=Pseudomonas citronellolis TaxID=53408 RepID=UPI0023E4354C|nr:hypothetical protein [Pseudomonas citronellolis]MDF3935205.1 hypothetical protein [Pseudomonas citronellolis]
MAVSGLAFSLVLIVIGMRTLILVTAHDWQDWPRLLTEFDGGVLHVVFAFGFGVACLIVRELVARRWPSTDD